MLPLVLWMSDTRPKSYVRGGTYSVILKSPLILAMMVVAVALCVLPLYINKSIRRVLRYPQFFTVDDPIDENQKTEI